MSRPFMALLALFLVLPLVAVAQEAAQDPVSDEEPEHEEDPDVVKLQQEVYWAPPGAGNDGFTWIPPNICFFSHLTSLFPYWTIMGLPCEKKPPFLLSRIRLASSKAC